MKSINALQKACHKSLLYLKRGSPTILSCLGAAGVVATTVMAVKATPKAITHIQHDSRQNHDGDPYGYSKAEAVRSAWRCYIPTVAIGVSTIACIMGANALNKRQQAALTSAYILLDNAYKEYKNKTKAMFGEDSDILVRKGITRDKIKSERIHPSGEAQLFYEFTHGEFFERTKEEVLAAEYRFNMIFASRGYATLNDFYNLLDLPETDEGDIRGWSLENDIFACPWIDFEHDHVDLEDGMECIIISMSPPPSIDYLD